MMSKAVAIGDQESNEIVEPFIWYSLKVQKEFYPRPVKTL